MFLCCGRELFMLQELIRGSLFNIPPAAVRGANDKEVKTDFLRARRTHAALICIETYQETPLYTLLTRWTCTFAGARLLDPACDTHVCPPISIIISNFQHCLRTIPTLILVTPIRALLPQGARDVSEGTQSVGDRQPIRDGTGGGEGEPAIAEQGERLRRRGLDVRQQKKWSIASACVWR